MGRIMDYIYLQKGKLDNAFDIYGSDDGIDRNIDNEILDEEKSKKLEYSKIFGITPETAKIEGNAFGKSNSYFL